MPSKKYLEKSEPFVKAMEIAIRLLESKTIPLEYEEMRLPLKNLCLESIENAKNPEPAFANTTSLKFVINAAMTYFNEGNGMLVNRFWEEVHKARLPFKRENQLKKILKRGTLKDAIEYELVMDLLGPYEQEGVLTREEHELLNHLIAEFEQR